MTEKIPMLPWFPPSIHAWMWHLMQAPPSPAPTASPSPTIDPSLLQSQLEFLKDANTRLANSFQSFTGTINTAFVILTAILGILGAIGLFLYGQTLKEAKQTIEAQVRREVDQAVSRSIKRRVDNLKVLLDQEDTIKQATIDYWIPIDRNAQPPLEYRMLDDRGLQVRFRTGSNGYDRRTDVTVVDLVNSNFSKADMESFLMRLKDDLSQNSVVVIYVVEQLETVKQFREKTRYYIPAGTPITLLGAVTDAASVAYSLHKRS